MKKTISSVSGFILCCILNNGALAETATATQNINLAIPIVALLDIEDVSPQFTFQAPQNAGDGLTLSATDNTFNVAISSNNSLAKLDVKIDQNLTAHGLSLVLDSSTLSGCSGSLTLTTSNQTYCNISMQQTSASTITLNATAAQDMASYGNYSVEITYTLTDN
ncbi:MAG: hypothetical protein ACPGSM_18685 [Thiolinea sp.]